MNLETIKHDFRELNGHLKESTLADYWAAFKRFAEATGLKDKRRRALEGKNGQAMLRKYLTTEIPVLSRPCTASKLQRVWEDGVGLPWPVTRRQFVTEDVEPTVCPVPADTAVLPWKRAIEAEADPYTKLEMLLHGQMGWRPSHVGRIRWADVKNERAEECWTTDPNDTPFMVVASGKVRGFKKNAWVMAWLPPDVVEALKTWKAEATAQGAFGSDKPVLPFRDRAGKIDLAHRSKEQQTTGRPAGELETDVIESHFQMFLKRHRLPRLTPKAFRKFVANKASEYQRMDEIARCYYQGHKPRGMAGVYTTPDPRDAESLRKLADRQMYAMPQGPLGLIVDGNAKATQKAGPSAEEAAALEAWRTGKLGDFDLIQRLSALRAQAPIREVVR